MRDELDVTCDRFDESTKVAVAIGRVAPSTEATAEVLCRDASSDLPPQLHLQKFRWDNFTDQAKIPHAVSEEVHRQS